jgi:hypothetical protein
LCIFVFFYIGIPDIENVTYLDGILPVNPTSNDAMTLSIISNNTIPTTNTASCGGGGDINTTVYESNVVNIISNNVFSASTSSVMNWGTTNINTGSGKIIIEKIIFKTKQGFYLYLLLNTTNVNLLVYYKQNQESELTIFLKQLIKQFNNDKTINK